MPTNLAYVVWQSCEKIGEETVEKECLKKLKLDVNRVNVTINAINE